MENLIVIAIIAVIVILASLYLYKAKKRGEKCVGCPYAKQCQKNCGSQGNCSSHKNE